MGDKLRILIVDDEPPARALIRKMAAAQPDLEIAGECGNGHDAVSTIKKGGLDLVLLDIQMPEMDGFAVLRALGGWELPAIIFVTAFDRYAVRAFAERALDYLLKPFDQERLFHALQRARSLLETRESSDQSRQIAELLASFKTSKSYLEYMTVTSNRQMRLLPVSEIACILAEDNYVRIHSAQGSYLLRDTLTNMTAKLDPRYFLRIHRSATVNVTAVKQIEPTFHGEYLVTLKNGERVTLSRTFRDNFFKRFGYPG